MSYPPQLISGLTQWLRADFGLYQSTGLSVPVSASGEPVGLWRDQSTSGFDARSVKSYRPIYTSTVATAGGMPALAFDNVDDFMVTDNVVVNPFTLFVVWSTIDTSHLRRVIEGLSSNWSMGCGGLGGVSNDKARGIYAGFGKIDNNVFLIHMVDQTSTSGYHWKNGVQISGGTFSPNTSDLTSLVIGGPTFGYPINGYVAEIIVYSKQLSTLERKSVESYLGTRYAIQVPP